LRSIALATGAKNNEDMGKSPIKNRRMILKSRLEPVHNLLFREKIVHFLLIQGKKQEHIRKYVIVF